MKILSLLIVGVILFTGCSVKNRNIITSAHSGVGIRASYNAETQLPEVEMGMIRSLICLVPVQLNTLDPANEDASKAVDLMASFDVLVSITKGIEIHDRYIINDGGAAAQPETAKALFESPKVKFGE